MFRFISFGSGSSGNSYYLETEQGGAFIDVGVGIRAMKTHFRNYGVATDRFKAILITHDHVDHMRAVGALSHEHGLPVYATRKVHAGIDQSFLIRRKVEQASRRYIEVGDTFEVAGMTITTIAVPHDASENVGYRVEKDGVVFVLLTDVGHITDEIRAMIADANYLVFESNHEVEKLLAGPYPYHLQQRILSPYGHISNKECGETLAQCATQKLRHVWLCHLSHENNDPELARYTVEGILRQHGIRPGTDFKIEILKRSTPSEFCEMEVRKSGD